MPPYRRRAVRQVHVLRDPRARARPGLGLLRHPVARPRRLLRARRLRDGHVSDAPDRHARRLRQSDPARLHGVPELEGAARRLVGLPLLRLRVADGDAGARRARLRLRLVRLPLARHRRLSVDHHPGADLRAEARLLPQRLRLRRQQRPDRLQGHPRLQRPVGRDPRRSVLVDGADAGAELPHRPGDRRSRNTARR